MTQQVLDGWLSVQLLCICLHFGESCVGLCERLAIHRGFRVKVMSDDDGRLDHSSICETNDSATASNESNVGDDNVEERFRVDRRKLEQLIQVGAPDAAADENVTENAEEFFNKASCSAVCYLYLLLLSYVVIAYTLRGLTGRSCFYESCSYKRKLK